MTDGREILELRWQAAQRWMEVANLAVSTEDHGASLGLPPRPERVAHAREQAEYWLNRYFEALESQTE
jgi:hypothetical protein